MPGLFFIALNRILSPAFYAQSDSKSPTIAGIFSFAVNMLIAAILVFPLKGSGIALALTLASAVNTALLLAFLRRNAQIAVGRALKSALAYSFKLALFSCIAALPVIYLDSLFAGMFEGRGKFLGLFLPLCASALVYGAAGIALLLISGDKQIKRLVRMIRGKRRVKISRANGQKKHIK
jgi:putative peptidoglycan lipid II flippase